MGDPSIKTFPRPFQPDTSAGYRRDEDLRFCTGTYTVIVDGKQILYRCVMAEGHDGNHRQSGMHWEAQGVGLGVEEGAST